MKNISKNILFAFSKMRIIVIWVRTWVNDAVHVQVKIVKIRNLKILNQITQYKLRKHKLDLSRFFIQKLDLTQLPYQLQSHLMFLNNLTQTWISFTNPPIKLWHSHRY